MSITITPGTFNPISALRETMGAMVWPRFPSPITHPEQDYQWQTRASDAEEDTYDDSPLLLPAAEIWPTFQADSNGSGNQWLATRALTMPLEWQGLPAGHTVKINMGMPVPVADGGMSVGSSLAFIVQMAWGSIYTAGAEVWEALFSVDLNGRDFACNGGNALYGSYRLPNYGIPGVDYSVNYEAHAANSIYIQLLDPSGAKVLGWYVTPALTTTHQLRSAASPRNPSQSSARTLLLKYSAARGYQLRMPEGFSATLQ
jgi:hypothetical protein